MASQAKRFQPQVYPSKYHKSRDISSLTTMALGLALLAIIAATSFQYFTSGSSLSHPTISSELGPKLSPNASIILPDAAEFDAATTRWTEYQAPSFSAVVKVAIEKDVQETISYANMYGIPFLVTNGKHGDYATLENLKSGIQIWHKDLDYVVISPDGTYATIGGGVKVKQVVDTLSAANKRAVTGVCDCVGMGGAMLGGGHGFLQGQYGLAADSMLEARVVLANASVITASETSYPDLFWALKGAGHNFGIVTEWKHKIHNFNSSKPWAYQTFTFTEDRLEDVFRAANDIVKTQPPQAVHAALFSVNQDVDSIKPVITWIAVYDGLEASLKAQTRALQQLKPVLSTSGQTSYKAMPSFWASGQDDPACAKGFTFRRYPIDLKMYNSTAIRQTYSLFAQTVAEVPSLNASTLFFEQYSVQGVRAVPSDSTAFPHRGDNFMVSPFIAYAPDSALDETAHKWGQDLRATLLKGTGSSSMHSYVNYAHGDEPLEALYGWESWRLEKLRRLKMEYDPDGKFSFYAPIS